MVFVSTCSHLFKQYWHSEDKTFHLYLLHRYIIGEFANKLWAQITKEDQKLFPERWNNGYKFNRVLNSYKVWLEVIDSIHICFQSWFYLFCLWKQTYANKSDCYHCPFWCRISAVIHFSIQMQGVLRVKINEKTLKQIFCLLQGKQPLLQRTKYLNPSDSCSKRQEGWMLDFCSLKPNESLSLSFIEIRKQWDFFEIQYFWDSYCPTCQR